MLHAKNRMQPYLPINVTYFNDRKYDYLQKTIYHTFRTVFLPFLPVKIYGKHFDKTMGRKTKDVQSMLGLFILQALFDLKDSDAVEAYTFDQKFHYALDIKEQEAYLSARAFYYYKTILLGTEDHIFEQILAKILTNSNLTTPCKEPIHLLFASISKKCPNGNSSKKLWPKL